MTIKVDDRLKNWRANDSDTVDDAHNHMKACGRWYWPDVAEDGVSLATQMFNLDVDETYAQTAIIHSAAAQAANGVIQAIAAALDIHPKALQHAISPWYKNKTDLPAPVDFDEFMKLVAQEEEELDV